MTFIPLFYNFQFWRKTIWQRGFSICSSIPTTPNLHRRISGVLQIYSIPSIKRTPRLPQLQSTQQQPKPNFVTPYVTPTVQTPSPTTAGAASTAAATSTSHAPPPTSQPTQQLK
ncbi:Uncharacterized protein Fot_04630 [Forsythia ovata]|uniref:Uncharacterized protein n=1 Tax=Forsythia ovata TaxID=205694 RepID=A0ABD1XD38_9LAMI